MRHCFAAVFESLCRCTLVVFLFCLPAPVSAAGQTDTVCVLCHGSQPGRIGKPVELWRNSIHAKYGVACNDCHGGDPGDMVNAMDPTRGFLGKPKEVEIPGFCGRCHLGVMNDYLASPHGKSLGKGGPTCVTCHGNHLVLEATLTLINERDCTKCHGFETASRIRESMAETESRLVQIDTSIVRFNKRGIDSISMEKSLFALRNRFHTLFHQLDVERIKGETTKLNGDLDKLLLSIREIDERDQKRRLAGISAIAVALVAALLLRLYANTLE